MHLGDGQRRAAAPGRARADHGCKPVGGGEALHRDRRAERADRDERPAVVGIERDHADGAEVDVAGGRRRRAHTARRGRWRPGWRPPATRRRRWRTPPSTTSARSGTTVGHAVGSVERRAHDTTVRRVARGDADERVAVERAAMVWASTPSTTDRPLAGDRVEQVDVDLRPLHHHVHEHVAAVAADASTSGHDSGVGRRSNTTGSSACGRCPAGGSECGGGTRRPRDRPRTRSPSCRAARRRWRRGCWGCARRAPRRWRRPSRAARCSRCRPR